MPIEIRELIIRAEVSDKEKGAGSAAKPDKKEKQKIIQECVDQVLEMLKKDKER